MLYASTSTGAVYLQAKCNTVTGIERKSQCKISDYTVEVHNIPHDTVDSDLLKVCMQLLYGLVIIISSTTTIIIIIITLTIITLTIITTTTTALLGSVCSGYN
jgi:hypothetical protein